MANSIYLDREAAATRGRVDVNVSRTFETAPLRPFQVAPPSPYLRNRAESTTPTATVPGQIARLAIQTAPRVRSGDLDTLG
jgi:hypothetical protein